mmetsp:Transcript_19843/g.29818  ORF Transcript_19843/g.29818 Transcript_19843/m.29818 type:complete len:120 (-) Transcript_19843:211-570(-)
MFSIVAKRSANIYARRAPFIASSLSTQTQAQLDAVEEVCMSKYHWADVKDKLEEIKSIMNEFTTNHAVGMPDADLEQYISDNMQDLQKMISNPKASHDAVFARAFELKGVVKDRLYHDM